MGNNNLKQVCIESIDEGRFMRDVNEALENLQEQVIAFSDKHGVKAKNAKAKLTVEVIIGCVSPEDGAFAFGTQIKQSLPAPPARVTLAMAGNGDSKKPRLFARASGTGKDFPLQRVLCTENGQTVDPITGEILEEEAIES